MGSRTSLAARDEGHIYYRDVPHFDPDAPLVSTRSLEIRRGDLSREHHLSWAPAILARSRSLLLHITLDVPTGAPNLALIADLGTTLSLASGRIASITVRAADTDAAHTFLRDMQSLPALRSLVFRRWKASAGRFSRLLLSCVPPDICAPGLETVEIGPGFRWPHSGPQFPNIRRISLALCQDVHRELGTMLDACPALQYLTVDLAAFSPFPFGLDAIPQPRCAGLRALRLVNLSASNAELALTAFHAAEIPDVSVSASRDAAAVCGRIFQDLGADVRLAVLRHSDQVSVAATDGEGHARRVSYAASTSRNSEPNALLRAILHEHIDWCNVLMLSVSLSHWYPFVDALPGAPAVTRLTVIQPSGCVVFNNQPVIYNPTPTRERFPALQTLDIVGADGASRLRADDIAALV